MLVRGFFFLERVRQGGIESEFRALVRSLELTPFFCGDFPYFAGLAAADEVALFGADPAHAGFLGDSARAYVGDGFGSAENREAEDVEPVVVDCDDGFGHQTAALPLGRDPEATVVVFAAAEADGSDDLIGIFFEAQGPVPLVATRDGGQGGVAVIAERAAGRIGPGDDGVEILHDFPIGEERLDLLGVGELEGAQAEAEGFEGGIQGGLQVTGNRLQSWAVCWLDPIPKHL